MLRPLIALVLAFTLTACAGDATIELTVHGISPGLEGSVIFLTIDRDREQLDWGNHSATIASGPHFMVIETATCVGNCGILDSPSEVCRRDIDVPPGGVVAIDIVGADLAPGTTCEISAQ
jgi:hypothetical protein